MGDINKLRANIKGQFTQFARFVRDLGEEQRTQLPDRIAEELYNSYNETRSQIAELKIEALLRKTPAPTSEELQMLEAELARERSSVEDIYFEYFSKAKQFLCTETVNNIIQAPEQQVNNVKLPTLQLPKFSDSYDQWLMYKDTLTSVIDSNARLSNIQKFQYLRSSLAGEALQVIHTLETTDENYETVWRLIKQRYENRKLIINTHIKGLLELQAESKGSHVTLRIFIDSVRTHIRALETLKEPVTQWNTLLIYCFHLLLIYC